MAHLPLRVGDGGLELLPDHVRLVDHSHDALRVARGRRHEALGLLEVLDARTFLRVDALRDREGLSVAAVEALGDVARQLDVLPLVVAHRDDVGLVEEDVARHQHGVAEEPRGDELLVGRLVLELRHAPQLSEAGRGAQQPGGLGVRRHVALAEDDRALGVDTGRKEHRRAGERRLAQAFGLVRGRDRVQVDDAEDGLALLLGRGVLAVAAAVVAERLVAGRADAGEDPHREIVPGPAAPPSFAPRLASHGTAAGTPELLAYPLVARGLTPDSTVIEVRGRRIGDGFFGLVAGPCTVETREQTLETARAVAAAGATVLRGGAFKPRSSPYAFQGLGAKGLEILAEAREETGLPIVTELLDPRDVAAVAEIADVIQIGARNMHNFNLLAEVGRVPNPVLLKRAPSATVEELLMAAEYVAKEGNERVILCERGIKTFERSTRYTLDLSAVPVLKRETHLPVVVDPSHAAGRSDLVLPLARAAVAAGADGVMVEVHPQPEDALCDGPQQIRVGEFARFADEIRTVVALMGKTIG